MYELRYTHIYCIYRYPTALVNNFAISSLTIDAIRNVPFLHFLHVLPQGVSKTWKELMSLAQVDRIT